MRRRLSSTPGASRRGAPSVVKSKWMPVPSNSRRVKSEITFGKSSPSSSEAERNFQTERRASSRHCFVKIQMQVHQTGDYLAFAFTDGCHVDFGVISVDCEFLASVEVRCDLGAMDHVLLGRQAMLGQEPPTYFLSMTAAFMPFFARVQDSSLPAAPLPSTSRSYSSGCEAVLFICSAPFYFESS